MNELQKTRDRAAAHANGDEITGEGSAYSKTLVRSG